MGLIKALKESVSSGLGDQFKEYVTCPEVDNNVLIVRGNVQHGKGNTNPSEGVISNGSKIVVPQGWAMMLVDNGKVIEFSAEPGEYIYDNSSEPSIFYGGLWQGIKDTIKNMGSRITFGGQTAKDQRVYYVNLLNVLGNKFGSPQPKKITDEKYGIIEVTFFGEYAYKVEDPVALVATVLGANAKDEVTFDEVFGSQLKTKFSEKITKAISEVMRIKKVSFGDMGLYGSDIAEQMNTELNDWKEKYGLVISDVAMGDINVTEASLKRINDIDDATIFQDANLQSGLMAKATADAMKDAAKNEGGSMVGFAGLNMTQGFGGNAMATANENAKNNKPAPEKEETTEEESNDSDTQTTAKFCSECGKPVSGGKFCSNCGAKL